MGSPKELFFDEKIGRHIFLAEKVLDYLPAKLGIIKTRLLLTEGDKIPGDRIEACRVYSIGKIQSKRHAE